jgi:glycosyltransferase involved in cell wall biosynthesis
MDKRNSLISILIPAKNAESYLRACIDSITAQTYANWELIVVNDHSTDQTPVILKDLTTTDNRIKTLNNEGHGIINALRLAYQNSRGNLITRMDADDLMSKDKLSLMSSLLTSNGRGNLAVGLVEYFKEGGVGPGYLKYAEWLNTLTSNGENFNQIYKECSIPSPCWMTYREDLDQCNAFLSDQYPEDYDLAFRFRSQRLNVLPVNKVIHYWRDHDTRASRNDPNYEDNRFINLKVHYFLKQDYDVAQSLILWGAGNKGKEIAKNLISRNVKFEWVTNNHKKIGKDIYGVKIQSEEYINSENKSQIIVTLSSPSDKKYALEKLNLCKQTITAYWFV